ncbi:MAG: hypothetical protein HPY50_18265 [Firmicutes bacterium]|nr:hypothetical protein [Bacillota bacterium]
MISETQQNAMLAQGISSACSDTIGLISSGNLDRAIGAVNNIRSMAFQISQNTQDINQIFNERLDMADRIMGWAQYRINELNGAMQTLRGGPGIGQPMITGANPYSTYSSAIYQ